MKNTEYLGGIVGTVMSATGMTSTSEVLQVVSLVCTIAGTLINFIILPLIVWYKNSKKDGKIDSDEVNQGVEIVRDGIERVEEIVDKTKKEDK